MAALAAVRRRRPDLVLTDVMMPNLDGFGLLRALRAARETHALPVIMLSARAGEESRVEGLEAGADDYLIKPFSGRELLARVNTHLQLARMRSAAEQAGRVKDISRITRGKIELHRRRLDVSECVARAIEMASPLLEQRRWPRTGTWSGWRRTGRRRCGWRRSSRRRWRSWTSGCR
jgi:DNA-binding response OmpR family regulator